MSISVKHKLSATEAAKQAAHLLEVDDTKRLSVAMAEAAADEIASNPALARKVRTYYSMLESGPSVTTRQRAPTAKALEVDIKPIKYVDGFRLDPSAPIDPYLVYEAYGEDQLATVLDLFSAPKLKQAAMRVEDRNPGTKPRNRGQKAALIEYIVQHIVH